MTHTKNLFKKEKLKSLMFSSVTQSCPTLRDPMNHSTPGLPVHHQLPEFTQTHHVIKGTVSFMLIYPKGARRQGKGELNCIGMGD